MERDDLDRFLSKDEIVPSSGFVARVMDAVRVEAAAPPAIPFPWSRALPGLVATAATFAAVIGGFFGLGVVSRPSIEEQGVPVAALLASSNEVAWVIVVLLLCAVPVVLSLRLTRGHS